MTYFVELCCQKTHVLFLFILLVLVLQEMKFDVRLVCIGFSMTSDLSVDYAFQLKECLPFVVK